LQELGPDYRDPAVRRKGGRCARLRAS